MNENESEVKVSNYDKIVDFKLKKLEKEYEETVECEMPPRDDEEDNSSEENNNYAPLEDDEFEEVEDKTETKEKPMCPIIEPNTKFEPVKNPDKIRKAMESIKLKQPTWAEGCLRNQN